MFKRKRRRSREFKNSSQVIDIDEARDERKRKRDETAKKRIKVRENKVVVTHRQAGKKARRRMVYFIILLGIICIISASIINIISLRMNESKVLEERKTLQDKEERLETEYSELSNTEYIEQQARQQLRMVKPGETLYVLPEKDEKTTDAAITDTGITKE